MGWLAEVGAGLPGMQLELTLPHHWLGPAGAALLATVFLAQAQARRVRLLLGVPAAAFMAWLLLVLLWRAAS